MLSNEVLSNEVLSNEVLSNEVLLSNSVLSKEPKEYFDFECNLTKKYLEIIINFLFMGEEVLTDEKINWFKIICFLQKNGYKEYELFVSSFLSNYKMKDYQYFCLCEIRTFDEEFNSVFYDNIFLFKVFKNR